MKMKKKGELKNEEKTAIIFEKGDHTVSINCKQLYKHIAHK